MCTNSQTSEGPTFSNITNYRIAGNGGELLFGGFLVTPRPGEGVAIIRNRYIRQMPIHDHKIHRDVWMGEVTLTPDGHVCKIQQ
jgi:hypothetical protein